MNERFRALLKKAEFTTMGPDIEQKIHNLCELIVKDCIEVCKSRVGNSDYNTGRMHCVSDLKEHFGVKE